MMGLVVDGGDDDGISRPDSPVCTQNDRDEQ